MFRKLARCLCIALVIVGCADGVTGTQADVHAADGHTHESDSIDEETAEILRYLQENFPSREQMFAVRACAADKTGYIYPDLPDDFGPDYLTEPDPDYVAFVRAQSVSERDADAFTACVFELGFEDNFYWPPDHEHIATDPDSEWPIAWPRP